MKRLLLALFSLPTLLLGQGVFQIPTDGSTDTSNACTGVLVDGGGVTGNYSNYDWGYFVIDPPGNGTVSLTFTSFSTPNSSDRVYLYDGVGTGGSFIGSYWGSSLPNSGSAISSTSGAITVYFYANWSGTGPGFQCSWSSNGTTAPTAGFTTTSTSISYNTPIQFVNTSTNGGTYEWDFGDGSSSTALNPTHSYTSSGTKTVQLIATNCFSSDTTTTTITVGSPPAASTSADSIYISVPCGTTASKTWTVSNGSGAGNLSLSTDLIDTNLAYQATFENGSLEGFTLSPFASATLSNTTSESYSGSHSMQVSGYISTSYMPQTSFTSTQATTASYATKSGSTTQYSGYFWFEDPGYSGLGGSPFGYTYWNQSQLRIYYRQSSGWTTNTYYTPLSSNNGWVHVSYENIDWTNKTFDIVVDGTTLVTAASFYNTNATAVDNFSGYTYSSAALYYVDDIEVGGGNALDVTYSPATATVAGGNNVVLTFTVDATNLLNGLYYLDLELGSNDTALDGSTVPVIIDVTGSGNWDVASTSCQSYSTYTGTVIEDTLSVYNSGCDTLDVSSTSVSSTRIQSVAQGFSIAPGDTALLPYSYSATIAGTYNDTIYYNEADSTYILCVSATVSDAPSIATDSTVFNVSYTGCPDSLLVPFWVYNDGKQTLDWGTYSSGVSLSDDFESSSMNTTIWSSFGLGVNMSSTCTAINGSNSLTFWGSGTRDAITQSLNLLSGGDVTFNLSQGTCEYADGGEGIYLQYSTNGWLWTDIQYFYTTSSSVPLFCSATLPSGAMTASTQLRLVQKSNSGSSYDNMVVDDFEVSAGLGVNLAFSPDTGNVSVGDSQLVNVILLTDSLNEGQHSFEGFISSNDPVDSLVYLTVNLTLDGVSETYIARNTCFDLDTLVKGATIIDSVLVENIGCDSLYFNSTSTSDAAFSATTAYAQIGTSDTGWVIVTINPTSIGTIADTVYVNTSDTTWPLCYTGYVEEAPNAWVDTSPIAISTVNCGDSVAVSFDLSNTAASTTLDWTVSSGEVLNVLLVTGNTYPTPLSNFQTYLGTVDDLMIRTVSSASNVPSELAWADVVIFPSITSSATSLDYTNIEDDMETFINDGGKMIVMGSIYVGDILAMDFINGYYYGNYTNYTHYVNTWANHPYTQGVNTFVAGSAALNARIWNTGYQSLVYYSSWSQALSVVPLGDGELIYYGFNFNTTYTEITTLMDNILNTTLADKGNGVNWMSFDPNTGSTNGGDTTTVTGWAYSDSLNVGTYNLNINVSTNDPTGGDFTIPVTFTVDGQGETTLETGCEDFGSVFQNMTHNRDVQVINTGCDTLNITSASTAGTDFSSSASSIAIAPGDTGFVPVSLYNTSLGVVNDTLTIYSDADTTMKCLTATIVGASDISVTPDPINVKVNKCNSFTTVPYTITNNGSASLTYDVSVAEVYDSSYTQTWLYPSPNWSNQLTFTFNNIIDSDTLFYDVILNGEYSGTNQYLYLYLNNSYVQTLYDNDVTNYTDDTLSGYITGWQLSNAITAGYFDLRVYSYNYTATSGQTCTMRVRQRESVSWAAPVGLPTGTVTAGQSVSKSLLVTVTSLPIGTYNTSVVFETNDPSDPVYTVPMTVEVVSEPDMELSSNALNYGTVYDTNPVQDSVLIENDGCVDLSITNIGSNNAHFVPSWTTQTIPAGSSAYLPVVFTATTPGTENGILTITNNDSIQIITLQTNVVFAPVADYQFTVQNNCTGLVSFSNESTNGSQYFWAFDDGFFSAAVNPTHTYDKPGTYNVMLVTTNSGGSDTTYKSVSLNDVLYVDYDFPDTVQAGQVVQFIDSSMYPTSWQWFFGDGNNSTSPNPQHTYANKGTYIVTLLASNGAGCSGSSNQQIIISSGIGINEWSPEDLVVYPNPTTGIVQVSTLEPVTGIKLFDLTGKLLLEVSGNRSLDLREFPAGSYQMVIQGEGWLTHKAIELVK